MLELEARRANVKPKDRVRIEAKIDDARERLNALRVTGPAPADAQSAFLSSLTFGLLDPRQMRIALVALFSMMVEMCATLGMFASLSHAHAAAAPTAGTPNKSRWTG